MKKKQDSDFRVVMNALALFLAICFFIGFFICLLVMLAFVRDAAGTVIALILVPLIVVSAWAVRRQWKYLVTH